MPLSAFPKCFLDDPVVHKTMTVEQWIELAADSLDLDGLEFFWGFVPHESPASILKHGVIGRGLNDYDKIFSILRSVNFQGWISIEDGQDPACGLEHLRLSGEFLRAKMKQHGLP